MFARRAKGRENKQRCFVLIKCACSRILQPAVSGPVGDPDSRSVRPAYMSTLGKP